MVDSRVFEESIPTLWRREEMDREECIICKDNTGGSIRTRRGLRTEMLEGGREEERRKKERRKKERRREEEKRERKRKVEEEGEGENERRGKKKEEENKPDREHF